MRICLFILSCLLLPLHLWSSDLSEIQQAGEEYFDSGEYNKAVTEFLRYEYFSPGDSAKDATIFGKTAQCYVLLGREEQAETYFSKAMSVAPTEEIYAQNALASISMNIASQQFDLAQQQILNLQMTLLDSVLRRKVQLYEGINELYRYNWNDAHQAFRAYFSEPAQNNLVDSLFTSSAGMKLKNPDLAWKLSLVLPGLGQIYGGDYINGIRSIILDGLLFYNLGYTYSSKETVTVVLAGILLLNRYIIGNRDHAARVVNERNDRIRLERANSIMEGMLYELK